MPVSKVMYGADTLIDLTDDTVTPEVLLSGTTAHNAMGEKITGTMQTSNLTQTIVDNIWREIAIENAKIVYSEQKTITVLGTDITNKTITVSLSFNPSEQKLIYHDNAGNGYGSINYSDVAFVQLDDVALNISDHYDCISVYINPFKSIVTDVTISKESKNTIIVTIDSENLTAGDSLTISASAALKSREQLLGLGYAEFYVEIGGE